MRQHRWLELVKDYGCEILYHPGKSNYVADAFSLKSVATVLSIQAMSEPLQQDIWKLELEFISGQLSTLTLQPTILDRIKSSQELDPLLMKLKEKARAGKNTGFNMSQKNVLHFKGRLCIPDDSQLKEEILSEVHSTPYSVHPGATKMYKDLKE